MQKKCVVYMFKWRAGHGKGMPFSFEQVGLVSDALLNVNIYTTKQITDNVNVPTLISNSSMSAVMPKQHAVALLAPLLLLNMLLKATVGFRTVCVRVETKGKGEERYSSFLSL